MKKCILRKMVAIFVLCFMCALAPKEVIAAKTVPSGYTAISTPEQLNNIKNNLSGKYILMSDIDLTEALSKGGSLYTENGWIPIGYSSTDPKAFTGVLDGNGYTIKGFVSKATSLIYHNQGTIQNLTISGTAKDGGWAPFVHKNEGLVQNCHNNVVFSGIFYAAEKYRIGGIVNMNYADGIVEYCSNDVDITVDLRTGGGSGEKGLYIGGIAGRNEGIVRKCFNKGNITCNTKSVNATAAGIVGAGNKSGVIENCYNTGAIYTSSDTSGTSCSTVSSGIMGTIDSTANAAVTIQNCYNTGSVSLYNSSSKKYQGAIVGANESYVTFKKCYWLDTSCTKATNGGTTNSNITKLTSSQMRSQSSYAGFDFTNTWTMSSYPVFKVKCTHIVDKVAAKASTCTENGNTAYWYCDVCSKYFKDSNKNTEISKSSTVIPAAHTWAEAEELEERQVSGSGENCQDFKEYYYGCSKCDAVSTTETFVGNAMGDHVLSEEWSTEDGAHYRECAVEGCDYEVERDKCSGGTATCTEKAVCATCGQEYGSVTGHEMAETSEAIKEATCTESGLFKYKCANCDYYVTEEKEALGHEFASEYTVDKKATMSADGNKSKHCTRNGCDAKTSTTTIPKISSVKLSKVNYTYNGSAKKPTVTVKDSKGTTLKNGTDYSVSYASGRTKIGKYKVTVNFKGAYKGSKVVYFEIGPKNPSSIKTALYGYDDVKVSWSKVTGATGYKVYYKKSTNSSWTLLKKTTATSCKKENLNDGVKYDFKVVTYKTVNENACENAGKTSSLYTLKKVTGVKAATSSGKVKIRWTNIQGETGYQISQSSSKTGTKIVSTYGTTSGTSKTVSAAKDKNYYYKVRAYKTVDGQKIYAPWSDVKAYKR